MAKNSGQTADTPVHVTRGVWLPPGEADLATTCAAVLSSLPPHSVVAGMTAARLHDLWLPAGVGGLEFATSTPERRPRGMTYSRRREIVVRRLELHRDDVTMMRGLAITSPARTWRDLAASLSVPALVAAGDSVLRVGTSIDSIVECVRRGVHVRGIRRARAAIPLLDGRSRSRPESHLRVAASGVAGVVYGVNEPVHRVTGGWLAEPDLSVTEAKLAIEYQGEVHADVERMRRDMTRFADLRSEGWLVLPYGPAEVFGRPWQIECEIRAAIRERAPQLLAANT